MGQCCDFIGFAVWHSVLALLVVLCDSSTWWGVIRTIIVALISELVYATSLAINKQRPDPGHFKMAGKRVVVTGGNSGIGFSIAKQVLASGASHVVLVARNKERLESCTAELDATKSPEQEVCYISMDLSHDSVQVKISIDALCVRIGGIDVLVNCAGYSIPGEFRNLDGSAFTNMMDANYFSAVNVSRAVAPHMIRQSFGQMVFVSSVAGQLGVYGFTAYSPSKYAVRGLCEVLYTELRPYGIGVSLVFPPDTETPGLAKEDALKPKVTKIISEQAGLWKSDTVARLIVDGVTQRKYMIGCGSDGYFINALTCGAAPASSLIEFWGQLVLMPVLRVYMLFMNTYFTHLIDTEHKLKVE